MADDLITRAVDASHLRAFAEGILRMVEETTLPPFGGALKESEGVLG